MFKLVFLIIIITSFLFILKPKDKLSKLFIFVFIFIWYVPLIISFYNPFDLFPVSDETYFIVFLGIFAFFFGFCLLDYKNKKIYYNLIYDNFNKIIIESKIIKSIFFISLFTIISLAIIQWRLIDSQGGMGNLKLDFFELVFNSNSALYFYYQVIIVPIFFISCMIISYFIINGKINKDILPMIIYIIFFTYLGGKRGYFSIVLQYVFLAFVLKVCQTKKLQYNKNSKSRSLISLLLMITIMFSGAAYMTSLSQNGSEIDENKLSDSMKENMELALIYQIGGYRALDNALNNGLNDNFTFGRATLGGTFDYYLSRSLNLFGINLNSARELAMNPIQNYPIMIGKGRDWNFLYTSFYYFIFDFGIIGVFIFGCLFGIYSRWTIIYFQKYQTIGSLCLMGYTFIACFLYTNSWINIALYTQPIIIICLILSFYELKKRKLII